MKVFISWSGDVSRAIAKELFDWLPMVLQSVQPYMSSESIDKGSRWATSIASELEGTSAGIIVLTEDNRQAPWINFEAGALAKVVTDTLLAPLLFGIKPSDVGSPLSQFQVTQFDKHDVLRLVESINKSAGDDALPTQRLERMHDALWPQLEAKVLPILETQHNSSPDVFTTTLSLEDLSNTLEEVLVLTRQQAHLAMNPERILTHDVVDQILATASGSKPDDKMQSTLMMQIDKANEYCRLLIANMEDAESGSPFDRSHLIESLHLSLRKCRDLVRGRRGIYAPIRRPPGTTAPVKVEGIKTS